MPAKEPFVFSDFEESICFDVDDPDFIYSTDINEDKGNYFRCYNGNNVLSPAMSLTSLVPSNRSHSFTSISSLDEPRQSSEPAVLSIEELRDQLNSCFTCGVSWHEDHVSLDCAECGGYSLERPCAQCDGKCRSTWKRDLTMSHACGKAKWLGHCNASTNNNMNSNNNKTTAVDSERILKSIHSSDKDSNVYNNHRNNY